VVGFLLKKDGLYFITVEGISFTYYIDIQIQSLSYQDITATHEQVLDRAVEEYNFRFRPFLWRGGIGNEATGRFVLQFRETDWGFIKRVVSFHNLGLIPDIERGEDTRFYIGLPHTSEVREIKYENYVVEGVPLF